MAFYDQMTSQYKQIFGQNQAILSSLTKSFEPILAAGINQQGFSPEELTNLQSQATTGTGATYARAKEALATAQGAAGGGNTYIPSGAKVQQEAELATSAAQTESGLQSNIIEQDYAQGRQNYLAAAGILGGVAGQYNPTGFANAATGAGSAASTTANDIAQADNAAFGSMMGVVGAGLGGAGTAMSCPAIGSMYLMPDGSEKAVEQLVIGEDIAGIDGEPETIEEIQSAVVDIVLVITESGHAVRNSLVHAFALPKGGFTVAARCLGKVILTDDGPSRVVSAEHAGQDWVFNIITNGSHTYCADGVWGLGVGDGERQVGVNAWKKINSQLVAELCSAKD